MKKTIIAVWGNANTGKSSTIKLVFDLFNVIYKGQISIIDNGPLNTHDITKVFRCNNYIVGIESQGDPKSNIFDSLPMFVDKQCDLIICATRTKGDTVSIVEEIENKNGYDVIWLSNLFSGQKPSVILNEKTATFIHEIISDLFTNKY